MAPDCKNSGMNLSESEVVALMTAAVFLNTVGFILRQSNDRSAAMRWLIVDSLAPLFGAIVGSLIAISSHSLGVLLAFYAGFFLAMGATDLLPQAHAHPSWKRIALTVAGVGSTWLIVFGATR